MERKSLEPQPCSFGGASVAKASGRRRRRRGLWARVPEAFLPSIASGLSSSRRQPPSPKAPQKRLGLSEGEASQALAALVLRSSGGGRLALSLSLGGRARARAAGALSVPMAELSGLLGLAGGPGRVLLVGQGPSGTKAGLQAFARELFGPDQEEQQHQEEEGKGEEEEKPAEAEPRGRHGGPPCLLRREVRVRLGCCPGPLPLPGALPPGLVLVLAGAPSLLEPRERRLLREMLLDLGLRLPRPPALALALVGVALLLQPEKEPRERERAEEARCHLERLLRRTLGPGRPPQTLQAALHRPGAGAREVRAAACSALRAALLLRRSQAAPKGEEEPKKQRLPLFLKCLPWGRRRQQRKGHLGTDESKFNEG
ncbi:uncharacterized protein C2orf72 homolog isoform X2 [Sceloporus undulatus]|uniref:uncharacterized protein C2orf72 homolog isoform X2 n=1 Tax=Sceloporus undulatus TaxID=8520 RepID=UPI001C4A9377|nr:uncharacterized protein C2orf72 homolog isoform X2 [Sceloporus undulatus]